MDSTPPATPKRMNVLRKTGRILVKVIAGIIIFILLLIILVQIPPVQNFARKKVVSYLENKLDTKVEIGRIYIGIPRDVILSDIYIEDRQKDTLFAGGEISVDISLIKLLSNQVEVNEIHLEDIVAKVNRQLPDTTFNFQFIIDAFMPDTATTVPADTTALKIDIHSVILDNINILYKDIVTGNDMNVKLQHLDGRIDVFDPAKMIFDIPTINVRGFNGKIFQSKPLATPEPLSKDVAEAQQPAEFQLKLKDINISRSYVDYRNDVSAFYTTINLNKFETQINNLDLLKQIIDVNELNLANSTIAIRLGEKPEAQIIKKEAAQEVESLASSFWRMSAKKLRLDDNRLKYDDDASPFLTRGMDYSHLDAKDMNLHVDNFLFAGDTVSGNILKGSLSEKSGFILTDLRTEFLYGPRQSYLNNLVISTPGSLIRRSIQVSYPSLEAMQKDINSLYLNANIIESRIQVKDILAFAPQLTSEPGFTNPEAIWVIDGAVHGSMKQLYVNDFYFKGLQNTRLNIDGSIAGLPDMDAVSADLAIKEFSTTRSDLNLFIPPGTIPDNITIPEAMGIRGTLKGNAGNLNANLAINTTSGNATVNGQVKQLSNLQNISYDLDLNTQLLNLGSIMQMSETLGSVSSDLKLSGRGFDPATMNAKLNGVIHSIVYNKYNYKNVNIDGDISNQQFNAVASITDPNIDLDLDASGDLSGEFPSIIVDAQVDSIKTFALNLTTDTIVYRGNISANFPVTDPDRLNGTLLATQSLMVFNGQRMVLDTMQVQADETDSSRYIQITSAPINARLEGEYKLTEMGTILQQAIQPYFNVMPASTVSASSLSPYNFSLTGTLTDHPFFKVFLPMIDEIEPVHFNSRFNSDTGWHADVTAPYILSGVQDIRGLTLNVGTENDSIRVFATIDQLSNGPGFQFFKTDLQAAIADNKIKFNLQNFDKAGEAKYFFSGLFDQPANGQYAFSLDPGGVLLNYEPWNVPNDNRVLITSEYINVNNFVLSKNDQQIRLNSTAPGNAPINLNVTNFQIATITGFVKQDSLALTGIINGEAQLKKLLQQPVFTSDLVVTDLAFNQDTIGNLDIQVASSSANVYNADINLSGRGNDVNITGNYFADGRLNLRGDINALQLNTIEGSTFGAVSDASGQINGQVNIAGTLASPDINGDLNFSKAGFTVNMLGSHFTIDNERLVVNNQGLRFNTFTVKDSAGNTAVLDGYAYTQNFSQFRFDLTLKADNFRAINSTKKQNELFYGLLYFDGDLNITGDNVQPVIDGRIKVNENTNFTVVLPQQKPGIIEREGIVQFIDIDSTANDSLWLAPYDSLNRSKIMGFDIVTNIEIDREASFNMVIDEANGDFLNLKGEANLTAGIDPSGNVTLTGSYELYEGSYQLSFNLLRRKFNIQRGSRIIWLGTPLDATLDVTATYIAETAPIDLVEGQLIQPSAVTRNYYRQELPFEVYLYMDGDLMQPEISFDIVLPDDQNYNVSNDVITTVETRLTQLREQPSELNKQVFALMLLNRFVSENPFQSSAAGMSFESFARQSVSKLLTEQLNQLAAGLIGGVDINFDVESASDYTTGQRQNRTDLNVGLSKRLLNDRLQVTVGSNFELEGPRNSNQQANNIGGNIALSYQLSKDGRYVIRAYRKNEYEGVIEGHVVETGIGFIITLDYEHFRDLFGKKRIKEMEAVPPPEHTRPIQETEKRNNQ